MANTEMEEWVKNNEEMMKVILTIATTVAAEVASEKTIQEYEKKIQEYEKKIEEKKKEQNDKKLHNVEALLNSYIALKEYVNRIDAKTKASIPKIAVMKETESLIELLEFSDDIVNSIKEQSRKTIVMVQHMDSALEALELLYKQEGNERDFIILKKRYVEKVMPGELAERYNMSKRAIQKILSKVRTKYAVLLFGLYGVKLE